jgi:hypothetical protein
MGKNPFAVQLNNKRRIQTNKQKTLWPLVRELYRQNDRRLSAKVVPTFADRGCCVVE